MASKLKERDWNTHDVQREDGPDHKTVQKILDGGPVRTGVLERLVKALSKKSGAVTLDEIPEAKMADRPEI